MKKLIVCLAVAALAFVPSLQAGEKKTKATRAKAEAACTAAKAETACATTKVKAENACAAKTACCATAKSIAKRDLKGATLLALR